MVSSVTSFGAQEGETAYLSQSETFSMAHSNANIAQARLADVSRGALLQFLQFCLTFIDFISLSQSTVSSWEALGG
ncbi:hypothetical protein RRG08_034673 [Elysia crispata]|uniref:Uncharacterized protein n=1 Tax=Elysia crispata TaxID=231223 RepID=A0AAE1D8N4_9GAST|nr:hypothetical protein RRG08_034673 [Elysia crispata]